MESLNKIPTEGIHSLPLARWNPGLETPEQEFGGFALTQNAGQAAGKRVIDNRRFLCHLPEIRKVPSCKSVTDRIKSWPRLLQGCV